MRKRALFVFSIFLIGLIVLSLYGSVPVHAEENITGETAQKNLAFTWLAGQVSGGWPGSAEDIAFTLLALTSDSKLRKEGVGALLEKNPGKDGSTVKDSALALLALDNAGENAEDIAAWLLTTKEKYKASNLEWRMQLDSDVEMSCDISYDGKTDEVIINEDKKIHLSVSQSPKCLTISDDYWIGI